MTAETIFHEIPGGPAFVDWFGCVPRFHDATLLAINLASRTESTLVIHTWRITDVVDDAGFVVLDRHVVVTIAMEAIRCVSLNYFNKLPAIIFDLGLARVRDRFELTWNSSYGVEGTLQAKQMRIGFVPGKP